MNDDAPLEAQLRGEQIDVRMNESKQLVYFSMQYFICFRQIG